MSPLAQFFGTATVIYGQQTKMVTKPLIPETQFAKKRKKECDFLILKCFAAVLVLEREGKTEKERETERV